MIFEAIRVVVKNLSNPAKIAQYARFFKTGPGQYGEGDVFAGISMPECRKIAKQHEAISLKEV